MKPLLLLLLPATLPVVLWAQDTLQPTRKIRFYDLGIQVGGFQEPSKKATVNDFRILAPQSALLSNDFSSYRSNNASNGVHEININSVYSAFAGFTLANRKKTGYNQQIRLRTGLTYYNQQMQSLYDRSVSTPYDSATTVNGIMIFIDSVSRKTYSMNYNSNQLRLDLSFLWSTKQDKKLAAFYTGLGITAGMSFHSYTDISFMTYRGTKNRNDQSDYANTAESKTTIVFETFKNKTDYGLGAYVPIGIDVKLGTKKTVWKRLHASYEARPSANIWIIPDVQTYTNFAFQQSLGLRIIL